MFDRILNTLLILSGNVFWHAYGLITGSIFSGFVCHSYIIYVLNIKNGLIKNYITKTYILLQMPKTEVSLHLLRSVVTVYLQ